MNAILHDRLYDFPPNELLARQARQESNARSYPRRLPLALKRARGIHVEDVEGRVFIDCLAGAGTLVLGHNHPVVVQAMRRRAGRRAAAAHARPHHAGQGPVRAGSPLGAAARFCGEGQDPVLRPDRRRCGRGGPEAGAHRHRPAQRAGLPRRLSRHVARCPGADGQPRAEAGAGRAVHRPPTSCPSLTTIAAPSASAARRGSRSGCTISRACCTTPRAACCRRPPSSSSRCRARAG